ncbi:lytic transglycosylase domain-containing protein [Paraburkholderia phosphatilytica]|uniref:lytic transglycosylase domain-containing protein n=1 Tax=Paraburkholderia phosphatilytica TaxID=2282883 RepID=UPI000E48C560|nr:lytic transglycosylase domain-containing protein [Paraburkholderia phosphatilytica]
MLLAFMLFGMHAGGARAQEPPPASASFTALAQVCAPHVDVTTLAALVRVESGFNPYAIGVVGARLQYQPHSYEQALATARALVARGYDFSVGLGQVNVRNLARVGESLTTIFDPCRNLRASSAILQQCFSRSSARAGDSQGALRDALSCYYSGNFMTGYRQGYVGRILASAYTNWRLAHAEELRANGRVRPPLPAAPVAPVAGSSPVPGNATLHNRGFVTATSLRAPAAATPASAPTRTSTFDEHRPSNANSNAGQRTASRQQVTVRCAGNPHRWCTRSLDTTSVAAHGGLTLVH